MIRFKNDAAEVRYDFCAWNDVDDRVEFYYDDEIVAACMLHDVVEDCGKKIEELPVGDEAKDIVRLVSHGKTTPENRDRIMKEYYDGIASNPKAPSPVWWRGFGFGKNVSNQFETNSHLKKTYMQYARLTLSFFSQEYS